MIPYIRSIAELMIMTESRDNHKTERKLKSDTLKVTEDSSQRKRYLNSNHQDQVDLPDLPKYTRHKWIKGKKAVERFFEELDYNNQIQSSYDLTLIERQNKYDQHDAA